MSHSQSFDDVPILRDGHPPCLRIYFPHSQRCILYDDTICMYISLYNIIMLYIYVIMYIHIYLFIFIYRCVHYKSSSYWVPIWKPYMALYMLESHGHEMSEDQQSQRFAKRPGGRRRRSGSCKRPRDWDWMNAARAYCPTKTWRESENGGRIGGLSPKKKWKI